MPTDREPFYQMSYILLPAMGNSDYGQDIPPRHIDGKHSGPPFLPPQLLQVILNKDTPAHVSSCVCLFVTRFNPLSAKKQQSFTTMSKICQK